MRKVLCALNVSKHIAHHLVGEHHTDKHRKITGVVVMFIGVAIAKTTGAIHILPIHIVGDIIGYGIHGLGLIPFVSGLEKTTLVNH